MKVSWTKGLEKERVVDVRQNFKEALVLRTRLSEMLEDKLSLSAKQSRSKEGYESPHWAYLQADSRGYERALADIIALISE
jgi:hypothetical protein